MQACMSVYVCNTMHKCTCVYMYACTHENCPREKMSEEIWMGACQIKSVFYYKTTIETKMNVQIGIRQVSLLKWLPS